MTLPRNDAYNGRPVVPADQCDEDYSDEAVAKHEAHLSAKYRHLKAAADARQHERERIAEANRRSKERPTGDAQVITVAVDEVPIAGVAAKARRCGRPLPWNDPAWQERIGRAKQQGTENGDEGTRR
jgi:hypothetical protein